MNYSMIRFVLFKSLEILGVLLLFPLVVALIYSEWSRAALFALLSLSVIVVSFIGCHFKPKENSFFAREGFVITALIWIVISVFGALPFYISREIPSFVDAFFETVSGFTTTGASIMTSVDEMSKSTMFWRCFTHWIGGMGVLVFMLAVLPLAGGSTMHLMRAESPGPTVGKFVPKVKNTAKTLYYIYIGITIAEICALMLTGLGVYESVTYTFSTVGTGGFSISNAGINALPASSQTVITVFMILCGVNFSVYYFIITKKYKEAFHFEEMRWYLAILFGSSVIISIGVFLNNHADTALEAFHHSIFTVASVMTTTGFATLNFDIWPQYARTMLFMLMLLGACAGSTGGDFKVSRLIIMQRRIKNELIYNAHRKSVKQVYMDDQRVEGTTVKAVMAYAAIYISFYLASLLIVSFDGQDFETNVTAVAATLNNIGPGLGIVGPTGNYSDYGIISKIILSMDMLAGRLEFIPIMLLFSRRTWK